MMNRILRFLLIGLILGFTIGEITYSREAIINSDTGEVIVELSGKTHPVFKGGPYNIGKLLIDYKPLEGKPLYLACDPACVFEPHEDGFVLRMSQ